MMPGESAEDSVLTTTQEIRRMMLAVIDVLVSEITTRGRRLFELGEKFAFLTRVQSGGLRDEEAKAAMDLVQSYRNLLSAELTQEVPDLASLTPNLNGGSVRDLLLGGIRYGPNAFPNVITATQNCSHRGGVRCVLRAVLLEDEAY